MNELMIKWLSELKEEIVLSISDDVNIQCNENLHSFSMTKSQRETLSIKGISDFIINCYSLVKEKSINNKFTFYCWIDELAGQLRFSVISGHTDKLPFSSKIVLSPIEIISNEYLKLITTIYDENYLNVWAKRIN